MKQALLNFAVFSTSSRKDAARFLGITEDYLEVITYTHGINIKRNDI
jgi:hypothetical protein